MPLVDFAISYSSWEHDGLGRYGDPVDPWGDVKAMQRASCYVKPGKFQHSTLFAMDLILVDGCNRQH